MESGSRFVILTKLCLNWFTGIWVKNYYKIVIIEIIAYTVHDKFNGGKIYVLYMRDH